MNLLRISIALFLLLVTALILPINQVQAADNSFVTVVNPVRGRDYWDQPNQKPSDGVAGEMSALNRYSLPATWLLRFDALNDSSIINILKSSPSYHEKGLFLEVTDSWAKEAGVSYRPSAAWHFAGSAFLSGYEPEERIKLIDSAFNKFKDTFGYYPKSVGAWWIDSYSLKYLSDKYHIDASLEVADQYTTDNYQIWGQYWSAPYYPAIKNALMPAQTETEKIPIVIMQWASRDPVNGYGEGVLESTYSLQANDYQTYHNLTTDYFNKLVDIYTKQQFNQVNQIVVGLENSYPWARYQSEYINQLASLSQKLQQNQFTVLTMADFSLWYKDHFKGVSPASLIVANDPLGGDFQSVWFMNPFYRVGWFYNADGSVFRDVRQYVGGNVEPCFDKACQVINFATFATRVLDEVTYHTKLVVDEGKITNLTVSKPADAAILSYQNAAGRFRTIELMPRDISLDHQISSIDSFILRATTNATTNQATLPLLSDKYLNYREPLINLGFNLFKYVIFLLLAVLVPGYLFVRYIKADSQFKLYLSVCLGLVNLTLVSFVLGYLKISWLVWVYLVIGVLIFIILHGYREIDWKLPHLSKSRLGIVLLICAGTVFQTLAMVRSGLIYNFGVGYWGPIGHDGIWHQALINQLIQNVPPVNPAMSGSLLVNYHYFYDLLVAETAKLTQIGVSDLLYRFYPILLSVLLGVGTYLLANYLFKNYKISLLAVFFAYFGDSFGWIVQLIKTGSIWGGESAFWMNQPVSMNLNPPYAISLVLLIAALLSLWTLRQRKSFINAVIFILIAGTVIEFKVYAGLIIFAGLAIVALLKIITIKDFYLIKLFVPTVLLALVVFLPQNGQSGSLIVLAPFWFVHSMIDFPDRVGWLKLSQARLAYFLRGEWLKYILAEILGLVIFIVGNFGIRIAGVLSLRKLLRLSEPSKLITTLMLVMISISVIIPLLFIQKGNPWNTIQFSYYALYLMGILTAAALIYLNQLLPKRIGAVILLLIIVITPISSLATFRSGFYPLPPARLTIGELEALNFLKLQPLGNVLTYPYDKNLQSEFTNPYPLLTYQTTAYVAAFSAKTTYIEDEIQQAILSGDDSAASEYHSRLVKTNDFIYSKDYVWAKSFLKDNKISYIYLPKIYNFNLNVGELGIQNIFENQEVVIYKVLN